MKVSTHLAVAANKAETPNITKDAENKGLLSSQP